jgi:serine/threonine-protein kinase
VTTSKPLRVGSRLGKYKLTRRLGDGGFARVYAAFDTIEHTHVALKIPFLADDEAREDALREARLIARFDHPNILCLRNADFIDGQLVLTFPLGTESLDDRIRRRIGPRRALEYAHQLLEGLAYAHELRVIHRDIKPANIILFEDHQLRLSDFGAAHPSMRTRFGTSVGTVGYLAPEQGLGRSSPRADVFSTGLVLYRLSTGKLIRWPFDWPGPGRQRLRRWHPDWRAFLARSVEVDERRRFADGGRMLAAFERILPRIERHITAQSRRRG